VLDEELQEDAGAQGHELARPMPEETPVTKTTLELDMIFLADGLKWTDAQGWLARWLRKHVGLLDQQVH